MCQNAPLGFSFFFACRRVGAHRISSPSRKSASGLLAGIEGTGEVTQVHRCDQGPGVRVPGAVFRSDYIEGSPQGGSRRYANEFRVSVSGRMRISQTCRMFIRFSNFPVPTFHPNAFVNGSYDILIVPRKLLQIRGRYKVRVRFIRAGLRFAVTSVGPRTNVDEQPWSKEL